MTTEPDHAFAGWSRKNSAFAWRRVVTAESEAECWNLLLGHTEGGDKCVLAAGRDPNQRPAFRRS